MPRTITFADDYVIVITSDFSPGRSILHVSSAEWAFRLIAQTPDHLWTITRLGEIYDRSAIAELAITEGMEPHPHLRPAFDFQKAMRERELRYERERGGSSGR